MKRILVFVASLSILFCAGCFPVLVGDMRTDLTPRMPNDNVEVFTDRESIPWPYKSIGVITSTENTWFKTLPDQRLIGEIVERAKTMGADGVILVSRIAYPHRYVAEAIVKEESGVSVPVPLPPQSDVNINTNDI
ncbi:MAG: hypothetical protein LBC70_10575 [Chitinispirillales bacterium]|jgi:hypothetical protein|nr:hypothetical protein [Chitinispirillales bacterium]